MVAVHLHRWARVGMMLTNGCMLIPCKEKDCEVAMYVAPGGYKEFVLDGFPRTVCGFELDIEDHPEGGVAKVIMREAESGGYEGLGLKPGDVVVDIGAHVGIVSILLAKLYPGIELYCYEPVPENFKRLVRNLQANDVKATAFNLGVSGDGSDLVIRGDMSINSGGSGAFVEGDTICITPTVTLWDIFDEHGIDRLPLLKIDCEGAEYDIFRSSKPLVRRIDRLRGEFHSRHDEMAVDLEAWCMDRIPDVRVTTK